MIYRREEERDHAEVCRVVERAFENAEHRDGTEHELVARLRKSGAFVPELSLVAEEEGRIVGHIMFTRIGLGEAPALALAPLSVLPEFQRRGVGSRLMAEGHRIAKELGYEFSVVLGSENYYPRAGYRPASEFAIKAPFDVPEANFMALPLREGLPAPKAAVEYAEEFFA
ncbi:GNAT family N-acetyltransferase [Cloacibacillus porcorum]|uniref:GNAT family N-acetyltransferase n=1 Tax=Cloacibacillus porcorum TaxID=1197717 RepID=A0A1B2I129_9BACT|nr:N-acetyltransferase [Cloacibacillus porcorum]ANZ43674.1 GNAT family N-acetyltransferase [Cloacibacillus porcorum]